MDYSNLSNEELSTVLEELNERLTFCTNKIKSGKKVTYWMAQSKCACDEYLRVFKLRYPEF